MLLRSSSCPPHVLRLLVAALLIFGFAQVARAGSYGVQSFTFPNGTVSLGDGSVISSNDGTASVQNNALRLTASGTGGTASSFKLPNLDPDAEVESFTIAFRLRLFAGNQPADGFSVNFGNLPDGNGAGEGGFAMSNGITIAWDSYDNGGDPPSIEVFADGLSVGNFPQTFLFDGNYPRVSIHWDANGLDVTYNGVAICTNLPTPGFRPGAGNRVGFSGRTGGLTQDTYIDDLAITTSRSTAIETGGPIISEFVADNGGSLEDEDVESPDWIEIYNGQNSSVNLSGWTLTNTAANKTLWTFPSITIGAYQYLVVYASGKNRTNGALPLHTNFTLQKEGGYLALGRPGGLAAASEFQYAAQTEDVSFGEIGTTRTVGYLDPPTPGARNNAQVADGPPPGEVVFSREGGLITGTTSLSISPPAEAGAVVRYTTNNTPPNASSPLYAAPFTISTNTTIRARVFAPNRLPGPVSSRTFLRLDGSLTNYNGSGQPFSTNLPIIILDSFGVQVDSFNGAGNRGYRSTYGVVIAPNPTTGRSTITDLPDFRGRGGTHVRGESSAGFAQRQYAWELWNNEDEDKEASLLGLPAESDWILYAPWSEKTLMRDVLVFGTMRKLLQDYMAAKTQFCELFFNQGSGTSIGYGGSYRGVYVLKEKLKIDNARLKLSKLNHLTTQQPAITGGYIIRKDKVDADSTSWTTNSPYNIPLQSYDPDFLNSAQSSYLQSYINNFQAVLAGSNFANPTTGYAAYMEPDTFIDAQWFVEWTKQVDGYVFSTYFHKDRGGKLRAGPIWDFNIALGNADYGTGNTPTGWLYDTSGNGQLWYPRLHQDPTYKIRHWDRFWHLRRSVLATSSILADIDSYASYLLNGSTIPVTNNMPALPPAQENAVMRHYRKYQRLGQYDWPNPPGYPSRIYYNSNGNPNTGEVDYMKNWLQTRLSWLDDQNRVGSVIYRPPNFSSGGGNVPAGFQLTITPYSGTAPSGASYASGTIYYTLDGSDPRQITGTVAATARSYSGPVILTESRIVNARLYNGGWWSPLTSGVFIVDAVPANAENLVVSELHYHPLDPSAAEVAAGFSSANQFEFIELMNVGTTNVDLSGVTIEDGVEFSFSNADPAAVSLPPGGRVLITGHEPAFRFRYGNDPAVKVAGTFSGNLSNSGELLTVRDGGGNIIPQFIWRDLEPWPLDADGAGYSLALNNPAAGIDYMDGASWRPSAEIGGSPGRQNHTPFTGHPTGDSDGDGFEDFLEYALGTNFNDPASHAAPSVAVANYTVGGVTRPYLRFRFRRNLAADGCAYTPLLSTDASQWQSGAAVLTYLGTTHNGDATATVTYRSTQPFDSGAEQMFIRLRVSP